MPRKIEERTKHPNEFGDGDMRKAQTDTSRFSEHEQFLGLGRLGGVVRQQEPQNDVGIEDERFHREYFAA